MTHYTFTTCRQRVRPLDLGSDDEDAPLVDRSGDEDVARIESQFQGYRVLDHVKVTLNPVDLIHRSNHDGGER